jgi:hypothetical protein
VFGRLVAACDVEEATLGQLQKWLADYLAEVERYHGYAVGSLPYPRSWVISSEVERMPEDQLPAVILASPGLFTGAGVPQADGRGVYTARWQLVASTQVSARGNGLALRLARLYALAVRGALLQQQRLEGLEVRRIDWLDERYRLLGSIDDRTTCISEVEVSAEVGDVLSRGHGPLAPLLGPGNLGPDSPTWPTAQTAEVAVTKTPEEE